VKARSGMTLVELVVGSTVMVGIISSAYLCLVSGTKGQRIVERRMNILQNARVALDIMSRDLRAACILSKDYPFIGLDREVKGMKAANLDFATHHYNPVREGESDFCEVSYFLDRNPRTGGWSLFRRRDPTPDEDPLAGGFREEIAVGVRGFRVEYHDGLFWVDHWGSSLESRGAYSNDPTSVSFRTELPEAVRISLALSTGEEARPAGSEAEPAHTRPPPLLFSTVVRLHLAGRSREDAGGGEPGVEEAGSLTETTRDSTSGAGTGMRAEPEAR